MSRRDFFAGLAARWKNRPRLFRRLRFWLVIGLFLVILVALGPAFGVLGRLVDGFFALLLWILDRPLGRFLLVNVFAVLLIWAVWRRFRARGRRLLGAWALDRFLAGLLHLAAGRYRRAARRFEAMLRLSRWVDLRSGVDIYPEIVADARIKLSLCYREMGELDRAMRSLELLRPRELTPALRRDHAEAKAFVYARSCDLMEETIDREIANALEGDPQNRRLLRLRRDRAERLGDLPVAIEAERRLLRATPAALRGGERRRLAMLHARNALRLHQLGKAEEALAEIARSRASDASLALPNLLAGDIAAERGDAREAVREWARTPSLPALERIRALLDAGKLEGEGDLSFLVEEFPRSGILLVLGSHYVSRGKLRKARNSVRKFEALGFGNRHSAHLLAEILRREGDDAAAEREDWRALKGFLGTDVRAGEARP